MYSPFDALENKVHTQKEHVNNDQHFAHHAYETYRMSSIYLAVVTAFFAGFFLLFIKLFFASAIVTKEPIVILTIGIFVMALIIIFLRFVHYSTVIRRVILEIACAHTQETARDLKTLQSYEDGIIDDRGIHALYMHRKLQRGWSRKLSYAVDWIIYTLMLFGMGLFGLLFITV